EAEALRCRHIYRRGPGTGDAEARSGSVESGGSGEGALVEPVAEAATAGGEGDIRNAIRAQRTSGPARDILHVGLVAGREGSAGGEAVGSGEVHVGEGVAEPASG